MVDFHTHILPSMDDGSQSIEQSAEMLRQMQKQGIKVVVATPHFDMRRESPSEFLARRQKAMDSIKEVIPEGICVVPGAEVLHCGLPLHSIENLEQLCVGNSQYLLIESIVPDWTEEIYLDLQHLMMQQNITPVLAHIERYYYIGKNRKMIRRLSGEGAVLQMNADAFLKPQMSRKAFKILRKEIVRLLGSDCHNMNIRQPNLKEAVQKIVDIAGQEKIDTMMAYANKILSDSVQERERKG